MVHKFNSNNKHKLDSPERRKLLPQEETLRYLGLEAGTVMADIGCGTGYFTLPASQIVGSQGKVYGLDIMAEMLEEVQNKVSDRHLKNIELVQVRENDFVLGDHTVDYALICLVAHEAENLAAFLQEVARILQPAGRIAIIEWSKQHSLMGPPIGHRLDSNELADLLRQGDFTNVQQLDINTEMYALVAQKTAK